MRRAFVHQGCQSLPGSRAFGGSSFRSRNCSSCVELYPETLKLCRLEPNVASSTQRRMGGGDLARPILARVEVRICSESNNKDDQRSTVCESLPSRADLVVSSSGQSNVSRVWVFYRRPCAWFTTANAEYKRRRGSGNEPGWPFSAI